MMTAQIHKRYTRARASPSSDVDTQIANNAMGYRGYTNTRASPRSDGDKNNHSHTPFSNKLRLGTWNLGTLTGRSAELSEILHNRELNACCVQETKWKGSKSREIGHGYQLIYHGVDARRNGVGIILDQNLKQRIINVDRKSDRLIAIKLAMDNQPVLNIISAYAPQAGCPVREKDVFWEDLDELLQTIPSEECIHIGGDLNGHVGASTGTFPNTHGGYGFGARNQEGLNILNFLSKYNFKIVNTHFKKKDEHLITYKTAKCATQIDYIVTNNSWFRYYKDCKVIPGEAITSQHRLLVAIVQLPKPITTRRDKSERIKWKELNGAKGNQFISALSLYLEEDLHKSKTADVMWRDFENVCQKQAKQILGVSKGGTPIKKDTSWWSDEVKLIIKAKRDAFHKWQRSEMEKDRLEYKSMKSLAKTTVAQARAISRQDFYDKLENAPNENTIFKIAKQRHGPP
ncbi:craniofacial development protein 2-like [Leguminivora glycinivorella]|uniref:craniofacial development protein 2-like n=1 Tax=Leguminivora glycinivorella TaxID=1035111 RepID=UPI00200D1EDC|nr:craniofacial development protein 2-like [Leguminivora glycinivorella]